jgi:hypothetical protein
MQAADAGVTVAAEPFCTKEKSEKGFTADLTEQGYCPILLVIENSSTDNLLLVKDEIELMDTQGNIHKPVAAKIMVEKFEHNKMSYALLGFGIFSYMSADEANKKMLNDWSEKELPAEKVLIPSRKTHGVLYFHLGGGLTTLPNSTMSVSLTNMRTGEKRSAKIRIVSAL